ncbi:MAG: type II toxin-antitoxin system Phd/YefM family antitoxin [Capsulimonadaceae bacterium]
MPTVSATEAKNRIGDLWQLAELERVTIERNGVPKFRLISTDHYVAIPIEEYSRLRSLRRTPRRGFAKAQFEGFDTDTLLAVDVTAEFEGYNDMRAL